MQSTTSNSNTLVGIVNNVHDHNLDFLPKGVSQEAASAMYASLAQSMGESQGPDQTNSQTQKIFSQLRVTLKQSQSLTCFNISWQPTPSPTTRHTA